MSEYINDGTTKIWEKNEAGILVEIEKKPEKREKMRRFEWKVYFNEEEITELEYREEQKEYQRSMNGHM
jgi:hypothetical protein